MSLLKLDDIDNIYLDAWVTDSQRSLLFLSAWGHDIAIQELQAKLTLSTREGGLGMLRAYVLETNQWMSAYICERQSLVKKTGRGVADSLLGNLAQVWIYESLAEQPDKLNQQGLLLYRAHEPKETLQARLWQTVRALCNIPLLIEWHKLLGDFTEAGWISYYEGFGVNAVKIDLPAKEVGEHITHCVQQGVLTLPKQSHLKLVV